GIVSSTTSDPVLQRSDGTPVPLHVDDGVLSAAFQGQAALAFRTPKGKVDLQLGEHAGCVSLPADASATKKAKIMSGLDLPACKTRGLPALEKPPTEHRHRREAA